MKRSGKFAIAAIWTVLSAVFTFLILKVDVDVAGETWSEVGLVSINEKVFELFNTFNPVAYKVSEILGYVMILICAVFAMVGLVQWIKRKNMLKVDAEILCTGVLFAITIGLYVLFTKVAVTYRPIIVPGEDVLEPSFPSSHTMLAIVVMGATVLLLEKYAKKNVLHSKSALALQIIMICAGLSVPVLRLISGVHWVTDIFAGFLYAGTLLAWYDIAVYIFTDNTNSQLPAGGKHYKK